MIAKLFIVVAVSACVLAQRKPGDCPPPVEIGICQNTCLMDFECTGNMKCCRTSCGGSVCLRPVTMRAPQILTGTYIEYLLFSNEKIIKFFFCVSQIHF